MIYPHAALCAWVWEYTPDFEFQKCKSGRSSTAKTKDIKCPAPLGNGFAPFPTPVRENIRERFAIEALFAPVCPPFPLGIPLFNRS